MVRRPHGTTLVELLVTIVLFSLMMTVILGFYIQGNRITRRQDQYSATFRRTIMVVDKVETLVAPSRVYYVDSKQIVYATTGSNFSFTDKGPNWDAETKTICVLTEPHCLALLENGKPRSLVTLQENDEVSFSRSAEGCIVVSARCAPRPSPTAGEAPRVVSITRTILNDNVERY